MAGTMGFLFLFSLLLVPVGARGDPTGAGEWRYVCPPAGDAFEHPPLRAISLLAEKPSYLAEGVTYRGTQRRYGRFVFGSADSSPVSVVLDEDPNGEPDLYVEGNRNLAIEGMDRVEGRERTWRVALDAVVLQGGDMRILTRKVLFRLGRTGAVFSYAPLGFLQGEVVIGGRKVKARRVDGDGNGAFTDPQDRLWLDLNGDGRWDPLEEQFPFLPILQVAGERYAVRSEQFGAWLIVEKLEGSGTMRLVAKPKVPFKELGVALVGEDGSAVRLEGPGSTVTVPPGKYRPIGVTAVVDGPNGGQPWTFIFSAEGSPRPQKSYTVEAGATVDIEPFASLECAPVAEGTQGKCQAGQEVRVDAHLYTGDGLKASACYLGTGDPQANPGNARLAHIALATAAGALLAEATAEYG